MGEKGSGKKVFAGKEEKFSANAQQKRGGGGGGGGWVGGGGGEGGGFRMARGPRFQEE